MAESAQLLIVAKAVDQASGTLNRVEQSVNRLEKAGNLAGRTFGKFNAVMQGLGIGIGIGSFYAVWRAIGSVLRILPDLIGKGEQWASTVDAIGDATGMTVAQSSELAAVQTYVGRTTDGLGRALTTLARNAVDNVDAFKKLGIQTRDSNGNLLDSYTIFQNVRKVVAETGPSFLSTAAAAKVFGRGASELTDLLMLSNAQWAIYSTEAQRAGLILSESGAHAAEQWERTKSVLDAAISGLGAQILQGAAPALISLVNGITGAIHDNMDNIVRFAVQTINFLAGLIGGFLGIDFGLATLADNIDKAGSSADQAGSKFIRLGNRGTQAARGTDALSQSIERQIDKIDRQIAVMDKADRKDSARRQYHQLLADIQDAKTELDNVRGASIFLAGMSGAEGELARQAQAANEIEAQKKLADARKKVREFDIQQERDARRRGLQERRSALQEQLSDHQKALTTALKANTTAVKQIRASWTGTGKESPLAGLSESLRQAATDAQKSGKEIAAAIKGAIFGTDTTTIGPLKMTIHQEGLIDHLRNLATGVGALGTVFSTVGRIISDADAALAGALNGLATFLQGLLPKTPAVTNDYLPGSGLDLRPWWMQGLFPNKGASTKPATGTSTGPSVAGEWSPDTIQAQSAVFRRYLGDGSILTRSIQEQRSILSGIGVNTAVLPDGSLAVKMPDGATVSVKDWLATQQLGVTNSLFGNIGKVTAWNAGQLGTSVQAWNAGQLGTSVNSWSAGQLGTNIQSWAAGQLGVTNPNLATLSLINSSVEQQRAFLQSIGVNTAMLPTGRLGVLLPSGQKVTIESWLASQGVSVTGTVAATNPKFTDIGKILGWSVGSIPATVTGSVSASNPHFDEIGLIRGWQAGRLPTSVNDWNAGTMPITGSVFANNTSAGKGFADWLASINAWVFQTAKGVGENAQGGPGGGGPGRGIIPNARGSVGLTGGPMNMLMGEAGNEAYAILRNPKEGHFGMGGDRGDLTINLQVDGRTLARAFVPAGSTTSSLRPQTGT